MFFDVFSELCKKKGVSPSRAALDCGLSKSAVSQWKTRNSSPKFEQLPKIAAYFDVSVDYLLGNEEKPAAPKDDELYKDELIAFYGEVKENLDAQDIEDLKTFMRMKAEIKKNRLEKK